MLLKADVPIGSSGGLAVIAREVALDIAGGNYSIGELEHIPGRRVEPFVGSATPAIPFCRGSGTRPMPSF